MPKPELKVASLGYGNTQQRATRFDDFPWEEFTVVLPPITLAIIQEHDYKHEVLAEDFTQEAWDALDDDAREELIEAFRGTDGYSDWEDAFNPIMLYFWPLFMHGKDPATVAALIDAYAPAVSLIEIHEDTDLRQQVGEEYALGFSGGGMDLTDQLALAYICAGAVPPLSVITDAHNIIDGHKLPYVRKALALALDGAQTAAQMDLDRVKRAKKELRAKVRKINAEARAASAAKKPKAA